MDTNALFQQAVAARRNSYIPYSHFAVGACLLTTDGTMFVGCNVENASYGGTICAERVAFCQALAQGYRDFEAIAIVGGKGDDLQFCPPCGICRQFMTEFCDPDRFKVVLYLPDGTPKVYTLAQLLPLQFTDKDVL